MLNDSFKTQKKEKHTYRRLKFLNLCNELDWRNNLETKTLWKTRQKRLNTQENIKHNVE